MPGSRLINSYLVFLFFWAIPALSVAATAPADATVSGTVGDESAAVVPGVSVSLTDANKTSRVATTKGDGSFSFEGVSPGAYVLKAEISGFETYQTTVVVGQEAPPPLKITLRLRGLESDVTVEAEEPSDAFSTSISDGQTFKMEDDLRRAIPIVADDFLGAFANFFNPAATGSQGESVLVDGIEGDQIEVPSAAIGTARLSRNPYSALYQHPGRGRLEVSTKRGRRSRFDGMFEASARNSLFAARNAFAEDDTDVSRRLLQPTFGGPLPGRKSSFYFSGQRFVHDQTAVVNAVTLTGPVITNVPTTRDHNSVFARIQAWPNALHTITGTYGFSDHAYTNRDAGGFNLPERGVAAGRSKHTLTLSHRQSSPSNWRNEFLFGFISLGNHEGAASTAPAIDVSDAFSSGLAPVFTSETRRSYDVENTTSFYTGAHSIRFGARLRGERTNLMDASNFAGTFEFGDLPSFAAGTPLFFRINQGDPHIAFNMYGVNGYVQDEIRVKPQLTVTFGLRYDWQSIVDDRNNVAPRVAFAYALPNHAKTIFRGGVGLFYDDLTRAAREQALLFDGRLREIVISDPAFPNPYVSGENASPLPSSIRIAPGIRSPYLTQTSVSVEREAYRNNWISAEYSWLHGTNLFRSRNINAPLPGTEIRPDPEFLNIDQVESSAFEKSQALTVTWRGKVAKRFQPFAQYVFSKTTDDTSGVFSIPANNYDLRPEVGPAVEDRRHRLNLIGVIALPRGFHTGLVLGASTGAPYDITTGFDENNDSLANDRPAGVTRNTGRGPGNVLLDMRFSKSFSITRLAVPGQQSQRRDTFDLMVDVFNALNRTNVKEVVGVVSSPFFGGANVAMPARTVQFSARYTFRR
jgi:carboxypeptidase family protein/TonB-dependent receptor-like protein